MNAAYDGGMANGGSDEGKPGFRPPDATSGFFGAYLRDPTGNKICVFAWAEGMSHPEPVEGWDGRRANP